MDLKRWLNSLMIKSKWNFGKLLGVNLVDEPSGEITINFGKCYVEDGELNVSMDMRYPVTFNAEDIKEKLFALS